MYKDNMKTLTETISYLNEKGFANDFQINNNSITCKATNEKFLPEDLIIECIYRYEGDSNPDDSAILYAITAKSGTRGILVDSYGAYADPKVAALISEIAVREEHEYQDR